MDTDYSHYAVLHEAQHSETEPSMALQLLSACQERGPGSREGVGALAAGRGWAPHHYPGPPTAAPHVHHLGN